MYPTQELLVMNLKLFSRSTHSSLIVVIAPTRPLYISKDTSQLVINWALNIHHPVPSLPDS